MINNKPQKNEEWKLKETDQQREKERKKTSSTDSRDGPIFLAHAVEKRGRKHIEIAFDTLIFHRRERPFDWYQDKTLNLDKSIASKIRRGVIIPPKWLRIKIAKYWRLDTSAIWYNEEMLLADSHSKVSHPTTSGSSDYEGPATHEKKQEESKK